MEYLCLRGTKDKIAVELAEKLNLPRDVSESDEYRIFSNWFVDFISENHKELFSDDDDFQIEDSCSEGASHGFTSPDGSFFIGMAKSTYLLVFIIMGWIAKSKGISYSVYGRVLKEIEKKFPYNNMPFFKRIESGMGHNCILLESVKYRKKGIKDDHFKKYNGECIHNDLQCGLRVDGVCKCSSDKVREICCKLEEDGILKQKHGKFFYVDFI